MTDFIRGLERAASICESFAKDWMENGGGIGTCGPIMSMGAEECAKKIRGLADRAKIEVASGWDLDRYGSERHPAIERRLGEPDVGFRERMLKAIDHQPIS